METRKRYLLSGEKSHPINNEQWNVNRCLIDKQWKHWSRLDNSLMPNITKTWGFYQMKDRFGALDKSWCYQTWLYRGLLVLIPWILKFWSAWMPFRHKKAIILTDNNQGPKHLISVGHNELKVVGSVTANDWHHSRIMAIFTPHMMVPTAQFVPNHYQNH